MQLFTNKYKSAQLKLFALFLSMLLFTGAYAQSLNQEISGQVIDKESKQALGGVELIIKNSDPIILVTTNEAGYFRFENIPQGRFYVEASYPNSKYQSISKVDIYQGRSEVLCIELFDSKSKKRNKCYSKAKIKGITARLL